MRRRRYARRRKFKRRFSRRRRLFRRRSRRTTNILRTIQPFAPRSIVTLKYCESFTITTNTATSTGLYKFNLNSIYDPDRTGVGHQPYGFDQYAQLYNRYRVISTSYSLHAVNSTNYMQVVAYPSNDDLTYDYIDVVKERPSCKYRVQAPNSPVTPLRGKVYIPTLMGRTPAQYKSDDRYASLCSTSPDELAILHFYFSDANTGISSTLTTALNVVLKYRVEFYDLKTQSQS